MDVLIVFQQVSACPAQLDSDYQAALVSSALQDARHVMETPQIPVPVAMMGPVWSEANVPLAWMKTVWSANRYLSVSPV